jgi:hypothetical protein
VLIRVPLLSSLSSVFASLFARDPQRNDGAIPILRAGQRQFFSAKISKIRKRSPPRVLACVEKIRELKSEPEHRRDVV